MSDRSLVAAAACFLAATAFGAVVSVDEDIPGEPLRLRAPGLVAIQLAAGLGSGVSAPWPMPVAALVAALRARPDLASPGLASPDPSSPGLVSPGLLCTVLGCGVVAGTLVEPITWGRRPRSSRATAAIVLNLVAAGGLIAAEWRAHRGLDRIRGRGCGAGR